MKRSKNRSGKHRRLSSSTLRKLDQIEASAGSAKHQDYLSGIARCYRKGVAKHD